MSAKRLRKGYENNNNNNNNNNNFNAGKINK